MNQTHQYFQALVELQEIGFYAGFGQLVSQGLGVWSLKFINMEKIKNIYTQGLRLMDSSIRHPKLTTLG